MNDMKSIDTQFGIYGLNKENQKENTILWIIENDNVRSNNDVFTNNWYHRLDFIKIGINNIVYHIIY